MTFALLCTVLMSSVLCGLGGCGLGDRGVSFVATSLLLLSFCLSVAIWREVLLGCDVWIGPVAWFETSSLHLTWSLYVYGKAAPMSE